MVVLIERKPNIAKKYKLFQAKGIRPDQVFTVEKKESILQHIQNLPAKTVVVVPSFADAFTTQYDFRRIAEYIIENDMHLLFADMSMPEISKDVWESKEAKPYVEMIFAFLSLGGRAKSGAKVGAPMLIDAHKKTIIKMAKAGSSPAQIGDKIGFNRNTVYNYIRDHLPELKRDNRLSDSWKRLDKNKNTILKAIDKGETKSHLMQKYNVTHRIFHDWLRKIGVDKESLSRKPKFTFKEIKKMVEAGASIDAIRKEFHVTPSTIRNYLKENFPDYYQERFEARNKAKVLMNDKAKIKKALNNGVTKKEICEQYNITYTTLIRFLEKIEYS